MRVNMESAQLVIGAAIIDSRFCDQLLQDCAVALRAVERLPVAPKHVRLSSGDRRALQAIRADSLTEFARGVVRLQRVVQPRRLRRVDAIDEALVG